MREIDEEIIALLKDFDIETVLDMCDITSEEVLQILLEGGHIELPSWTPKW